jgi:hypothetical protein
MATSDDQSQDQGGRKELGILSMRFYIQSSFSVSCKVSNCQVELTVSQQPEAGYNVSPIIDEKSNHLLLRRQCTSPSVNPT